MRAILVALIVASLPLVSQAYEGGMLNMTVPSTLVPGQGEITVQHRFVGRIDKDPLDKFLGLNDGASIGLTVRFPVTRGLELKGGYLRERSEYMLGTSYGRRPPCIPVSIQADLQFFDFKKDEPSDRKGSFFYLLSVQTDPVLGRFQPCVNLAYDYLDRQVGLGLGAAVRATDKVTLLGEYYPVLDRNNRADFKADVGPDNFLAFGLKVETYGHHFVFMLSDGYRLGARYLMLGPEIYERTEYLYFGFNIQRLIEF